MIAFGGDRRRGMLLGVEPDLNPSCYRSAEAFASAVSAPLEAARAAGWLGPKTVAVYGEHVGTWLVALGEGDAPIRAAGVAAASRTIALRHLPRFALALLGSRSADRPAEAIFRLKAAATAATYQETFGGLARRHGITIVAGSVVLPRPIVRAGRLSCGPGPLENVSAVFDPDGRLHEGLARKCFPVAQERPWLAAASVADLPAFETPAGRLGVLVCADSWFPACWQRLRDLGVQIVAVPSHVLSDEVWLGPWHGYSGAPAPSDVDAADISAISEADAWRKYALAGRIASSGARVGMTTLLRGRFWDIGTGGRTTVVRHGSVEVVEPEPRGGRGPTLIGCWL
jgi:predicted amidohydrolase